MGVSSRVFVLFFDFFGAVRLLNALEANFNVGRIFPSEAGLVVEGESPKKKAKKSKKDKLIVENEPEIVGAETESLEKTVKKSKYVKSCAIEEPEIGRAHV